ncbi:MAG TPA: hypothetical protein EYP48_01425 [Ignisphaera sp.]|nr:hypothetical protein [Ignisphaera sp.]
MTFVIATLKCSLPRVEMLEESICREVVQRVCPKAMCALIPMLPMPLESYILASLVACKAQHKRVARKHSLEILTRLLAHRQISDVLAIVRNSESLSQGRYLLILHINNTVDLDILYQRLREVVSNTLCSFTDIPRLDSHIDRTIVEYIRTLHGIPEERIESTILMSIAGCSAVLM